jgi:hypothetical protein
MKIGRENRSTRRNPAPATLCPPQIPHDGLKVGWAPVRVSRDSVVGIATGYGLDDRGVGVPSPGSVKNCLFSTSPRPVLGLIQPPILWVTGLFLREVNRPGREADHSPPSNVEVKNGGAKYISASPCLHNVVLN